LTKHPEKTTFVKNRETSNVKRQTACLALDAGAKKSKPLNFLFFTFNFQPPLEFIPHSLQN